MNNEWEIVKATGRCAVTQREFAEGESYYAVLFETPQGFQRSDYCAEAWSGPPAGCFCYWRARVPVRRQKAAQAVDQDLLVQFFQRLEDEQEQAKQHLRFVLAMLLMRKRRLKLERTAAEGEREYWLMRLTDDQSMHRVLNPRLTDEQVARLNAQLSALLSGEVDSVESLDLMARPPAAGGRPPESEHADAAL